MCILAPSVACRCTSCPASCSQLCIHCIHAASASRANESEREDAYVRDPLAAVLAGKEAMANVAERASIQRGYTAEPLVKAALVLLTWQEQHVL